MREHLALLGLLLAAGNALADKKPTTKASDKPKPIDIKPVIEKLDVYKSDTGAFIVTPRAQSMKDSYELWVFYGDGKAMYQQRIVGTSIVPTGEYEWTVWSPRVRGIQNASIAVSAKGMTIQCKAHEHVALTKLSDPDATAFLTKAKFSAALWQRQAHFLARDEDGVYFYVDQLQEEYGGNGFRVFSGQKGAMKELPMTNVVSDSAGEVFATKTGELKIVASEDGKAYWKKGGKKTELIVLPPTENRYLIYRDLGIYGVLGVVCDDQ